MADKNLRISIKTFFDRGVDRFVGTLDRGIKRAQAFGAAMRRGFHSAPVRLLRNALAALIGTLAAGVMQAAKFNIELARAWTMSSKGEGWFREMRNSLREMSAELGVAKDQLTGGLYKALSAGVPEDNVLNFLSIAAKAAVADGSDIATAVDGITTVLDSFGMKTEDTQRITDLMFQSVAKGKLTFGELAHSISQAASVASVMGVSAEEVFAAVSQLSKTQEVSTATINLRNIMLSLNKALGEGWSETMTLQEALNKVYKDAGGSQTKLEKIFGRENLPAMLKLSGSNAQEAARFLEDMGDSAGRMEGAFQKVDQFRHWPKLWQSVAGLVERTAQEADSRLAPAIIDIIESIARIQDNDELWAGLGDTIDEAQERITGIFEYIRSEGGSGAMEVVEALGQILLGHAKNGAQDAVALLAKWMPLLGRSLGDSAKKAITEHFEINAIAKQLASDELGPVPKGKEAQKEYGDKYSALVEEKRRQMIEIKGREEGDRLSGIVGGDVDAPGLGDADIAKGKAALEKKSSDGLVQKVQREETNRIQAEFDAQMATQAQADQLAKQQRFEAAKSEALGGLQGAYRSNQKEIVSGKNEVANAALHGTKEDLTAAQGRLQKDQAEAEEIKRLATELKNATGETQAATITIIEAMVAEQRQQASQIATLASQIKNSRS